MSIQHATIFSYMDETITSLQNMGSIYIILIVKTLFLEAFHQSFITVIEEQWEEMLKKKDLLHLARYSVYKWLKP